MSIDWIPARKIKPQVKGNRGYIPTRKNPSGIVQYESCLERDFLLLAIHDPSVTGIQHQPKTIIYQDKIGKSRKYTPDAYLEFRDGKRLLIEIKPSEEVKTNSAKFEDRWNAARIWADSNSMRFIIVTENEIRSPRWMNVWFTLGASKCRNNDQFVDKLDKITNAEGDSYNDLCFKVSESLGVEIGKAAQIICYAIYHGFVFVDEFSS